MTPSSVLLVPSVILSRNLVATLPSAGARKADVGVVSQDFGGLGVMCPLLSGRECSPEHPQQASRCSGTIALFTGALA